MNCWTSARASVVCLSLLSGSVYCSGNESIELSGFGDIVKHWNDKYGRDRQDET
jgi:hypothetical protein